MLARLATSLLLIVAICVGVRVADWLIELALPFIAGTTLTVLVLWLLLGGPHSHR